MKLISTILFSALLAYQCDEPQIAVFVFFLTFACICVMWALPPIGRGR